MTQPMYSATPRAPHKTLRADREPVNTIDVTIDVSQELVEGQVIGRKNQKYTQTHDGTTDGTFTLTVNGETTSALDHDDSAADIQAALLALDTLITGDVVVTGGILDTNPVVIEFKGRYAGVPVALTADLTGLTGGTNALVQTTVGGLCVASEPDATDGSEVPFAILSEDVTTPADATAKAIAYDAGRFNKGALVIGDHAVAAVEHVLRAKGVFLVTARPAV